MISPNRLKEMTLEDIENNLEKHLEEYAELLKQLDQLEAENEKWKKYGSFYLDKFIQLKQTLTEIKEIAKFQLKDDCKDFRILNCNIDVIKQILQKISEVEE